MAEILNDFAWLLLMSAGSVGVVVLLARKLGWIEEEEQRNG